MYGSIRNEGSDVRRSRLATNQGSAYPVFTDSSTLTRRTKPQITTRKQPLDTVSHQHLASTYSLTSEEQWLFKHLEGTHMPAENLQRPLLGRRDTTIASRSEAALFFAPPNQSASNSTRTLGAPVDTYSHAPLPPHNQAHHPDLPRAPAHEGESSTIRNDTPAVDLSVLSGNIFARFLAARGPAPVEPANVPRSHSPAVCYRPFKRQFIGKRLLTAYHVPGAGEGSADKRALGSAGRDGGEGGGGLVWMERNFFELENRSGWERAVARFGRE